MSSQFYFTCPLPWSSCLFETTISSPRAVLAPFEVSSEREVRMRVSTRNWSFVLFLPGSNRSDHAFSLHFMIPFLAVNLALLYYNWYVSLAHFSVSSILWNRGLAVALCIFIVEGGDLIFRSSPEGDDLMKPDMMSVRLSVHTFLSDLDESWYVFRGRCVLNFFLTVKVIVVYRMLCNMAPYRIDRLGRNHWERMKVYFSRKNIRKKLFWWTFFALCTAMWRKRVCCWNPCARPPLNIRPPGSPRRG